MKLARRALASLLSAALMAAPFEQALAQRVVETGPASPEAVTGFSPLQTLQPLQLQVAGPAAASGLDLASLALPSLGALTPGAAGASSARPAASAAARAQARSGAQASLVGIHETLSQRGRAENDAAPALDRLFSGEKDRQGLNALPVGPIIEVAAHILPVLPAAYAARQWKREVRTPGQPAEKPKTSHSRLFETAELGAIALVAAIPSFMARSLFGDGAVAAVVLAGLWFGVSAAMVKHLADLRGETVTQWQASHDQKYRTDYNTGQLRDIRGHKYGSDRYDENIPGSVGPGARLAIRLATATAGLLFLAGSGFGPAVVYNAALAGLFLWADKRSGSDDVGVPPGTGLNANEAQGRRETPSFLSVALKTVFLAGVPFIGAVAVHEFGHYVTARLLRVPVYGVKLIELGANGTGEIMLRGYVKSDPSLHGRRILICLAGPLTSVLFFAGTAALLIHGYTGFKAGAFGFSGLMYVAVTTLGALSLALASFGTAIGSDLNQAYQHARIFISGRK